MISIRCVGLTWQGTLSVYSGAASADKVLANGLCDIRRAKRTIRCDNGRKSTIHFQHTGNFLTAEGILWITAEAGVVGVLFTLAEIRGTKDRDQNHVAPSWWCSREEIRYSSELQSTVLWLASPDKISCAGVPVAPEWIFDAAFYLRIFLWLLSWPKENLYCCENRVGMIYCAPVFLDRGERFTSLGEGTTSLITSWRNCHLGGPDLQRP